MEQKQARINKINKELNKGGSMRPERFIELIKELKGLGYYKQTKAGG